jgi:hypothetical protein
VFGIVLVNRVPPQGLDERSGVEVDGHDRHTAVRRKPVGESPLEQRARSVSATSAGTVRKFSVTTSALGECDAFGAG